MPNDLYELIGKRIRELRKQHGASGVNQQQLADELSTTPNTISRWETGAYRPSAGDLDKLAKFFGVSVAAFFPDGDLDSPARNALLRATADLNESDIEELTEYARFRKARSRLERARTSRRTER